jgi:hypothetical protein
MKTRAVLTMAAALLLAACAPDPRPAADGSGWVRLPPEAGPFFLDADRRAANWIGATLTAPGRQHGNPAAQATALGFFEFATVALAAPRWSGLDPLALLQLRQGREELRAAYGIKQDAPAQVVIDSFFKAAAALSVGDQVGAVRSFPPGILYGPGEEVVELLANPPPMRRVQRASATASSAINRDLGGNRWDN